MLHVLEFGLDLELVYFEYVNKEKKIVWAALVILNFIILELKITIMFNRRNGQIKNYGNPI